MEFKPMYVAMLSVPEYNEEINDATVALINKIKSGNEDISGDEAKIDALVAKHYQLNEKEYETVLHTINSPADKTDLYLRMFREL
ncbi:MAG: hypothetical protein GX640_01865 [Fibrobacter sp.]|nr:hypothetical protein [Fibrobacter sp.]